MSLRQYLQVLRVRWYVVVVGLLVGGLLAGIYLATATRVYTARAQLFVSTSSQTSLAEISAGGTFVQNQVKSYASVVSTPALTEPVIAELGLPYTPEQLAKEISATAPTNTVLIQLSVKDANAERAGAIANAVATRLAGYISQLETPIGQSVSPVKATVTEPAQTPSVPSSPKPKLDLALGLILGLVVGGGIAVALELMDNRVGNRVDVGEATGAPVVGVVGDDPLAARKPLILMDDAFSPRAESFRQLRTNVRFLGVERMLRSVVVTGSLAEEGKSLTAANLAVALAQAGDAVTLVDADLRRPSVATTFGLPDAVGLTSVLVGNATIDDAVQTWRDDLPLRVLTAGPIPPNPSELLGSSRVQDLIDELLKVSDIVLFDSPPLLPVTDAALLARVTDGALVVVRSRSTRVGQLVAATAALRAADAVVLGLVLNRVPKKSHLVGYGAYGGASPIDSGGYGPLTGTAHPTRRRLNLAPLVRRLSSWMTRLRPEDRRSASPAHTTLSHSPTDDGTAATPPSAVFHPGMSPVLAAEVRDGLSRVEGAHGRAEHWAPPAGPPPTGREVPLDEPSTEPYFSAPPVPGAPPAPAATTWYLRPPSWVPAVASAAGSEPAEVPRPTESVRADEAPAEIAAPEQVGTPDEAAVDADDHAGDPREDADDDADAHARDDGDGFSNVRVVHDCPTHLYEERDQVRDWMG
jgi:capsular exopolysaccharide synthesis family protein